MPSSAPSRPPASSLSFASSRPTAQPHPCTLRPAAASDHARVAALGVCALFLTCLVVTPAAAQTVVDIFPTTTGAWGLEYADGFLWVGDDTDGFIKKVDPANGAILATLPTPYDQNHIANGANHGVAWDGSGFWVAGDFGKDFLYKVALNGAFLDTIPTPTEAVGGLSWNGTHLVVTSYYPNPSAAILLVDPADGSIDGTIPAQGTQPYGIAWDSISGTYWNGTDDLEGDPERIWNLDGLGSVLSSFETPNTSPKGIALGGGHLWVIANTIGGSGRSIFKIDLAGGGTPDIAAVPAEQDFGIVALGDDTTQSQVLVNEGDGDLVITAIGVPAPFSATLPALPLTVGPGQQVAFDLTFTPFSEGEVSLDLDVHSNDVDEGILLVPLLGVGVPLEPTVDVTPSLLTFPATGVGLVRSLPLTIENRGFQTLDVLAVPSDDPDVTLRGIPELPAPLATFATLTVDVLFAPDAQGALDAHVSVATNDPATPVAIVPVQGGAVLPSFAAGEPVWFADGIENVVTVLAGPDLTGDGRPEAIMESYDAGASGAPSAAFFGNSHGLGVRLWSAGEGTSGGYGDQCLALGDDLDGDDRGDLIRGTAWGGRRVEVRSSILGSLLWSYDTQADDGGGWVYAVAAMPDVSGDGIAEVLAGAGTDGDPFTGARQLYCFDGATGAVRFRQYSPDAFLSVAWIEDINGDGVPEALGGAGGNFADDRVYCLSGASTGSGQVLWTAATGGSVWSLTTIDDVNGDGIDDVIAGTWAPRVVCLDGATGAELWSHTTAGEIIRVVALPDVTGDGQADVAVAELSNFFRVLDGATGDVHWFHTTTANVWSVDWIPDIDGDGVPEILSGDQADHVRCVSGADGSLVWLTNVGALVFSVRAIPDVTGNGTWDVLAGTQDLGGPGEGRIWCLEGGVPDPADLDPEENVGSTDVAIRGVHPNPMRDWVTFSVSAGAEARGELGLALFDAGGRRVRSLEQAIAPGELHVIWDGRDDAGHALASGVYYYRIEGLSTGATRGRITLLR